MTTLRDVARAAGVSIATASRALNSDAPVGRDLQIRVESAARRLRYVANPAGRALVLGARPLVALISDGRLSDEGARILQGAERELSAQGCGLVFRCRETDGRLSFDTVQRLGARAIILLNGGPLAACSPLPGVALASDPAALVAPGPATLLPDIIALAATYFRHCGRRRMAFIVSYAAQQVIADQGLNPDPGQVEIAGTSADSTSDVPGHLARWAANAAPPTALFCSDDAIAAQVLGWAVDHGIDIPRQLSVVGFGNTPLVMLTRPRLSSIRIDWEALGRWAARQALAALDLAGDVTGTKERSRLKIVERESSRRRGST